MAEGQKVEETKPEAKAGKKNDNIEKAEEAKTETKPEKKAGKKDNIVFIGKKPAMSYVLAVMTQFSDGQTEVHIKARGRSISRAVDVAEVVKNKFLPNTKRVINTATEEITDRENRKLNVSTIDIKITK